MPNQVAVELFYDGAWHNIVPDDDVLAEQPIVIKHGQGHESASLRPSSIEARLANDDDMYRTSNPESPLYGKAGRNTPVRVKVGDSVRGIGEVVAWTCGQSRDFLAEMLGGGQRGKAWCDIEAYGILQRIGGWTRTVQAPMIRWLAADASSVGLWPLSDAGGGVAVGNAALAQVIPDIAGVGKAAVDSVLFRGDAGPAGGEECLIIRPGVTGTEVSGKHEDYDHSGWQYVFHFKLDEVPPDATYRTLRHDRLTNASTVEWQLNDGAFRIVITTADGTEVLSNAAVHTATTLTEWVRCRLKVTVSGSTVTVEPSWAGQDAVTYGVTDTYSASSTGALMDWNLRNPFDFNVAVSTVFGTTDTALTLDGGDAVAVFNGLRGELAGWRWYRLLVTESSLPYSYIGSASDFLGSAQMGPQRPKTLIDNLLEVAATEDGLIFDDIDNLRPVLFLRRARYNQTPVTLALTDLPAPPDEVIDDLDKANVVTVEQVDGSSVTAADNDGPLGTQDPPDGIGEIRRRVLVNVADETADLPQLANWWLRRSTVNLPRYPRVAVNLAAVSASLLAEIEALGIGNVIEITGFREQTVRLIVIGWTEVIGWPNSRWITFDCVPDQQFNVGSYDDELFRYDSRSTVLKTAVDRNETSLVFRTTDKNDLWSTTASYLVMIAGERILVTSMGAASLVSGAWDQTATVERSTNGVVKDLAAEDPIHVANPGRWAL